MYSYDFSSPDLEVLSLTSLPEPESEVVTNSGRVNPVPRDTIKWSHGNCNPTSSLFGCKDNNIFPPTSKSLIMIPTTLEGGRKRKMKSNKSKKYKYRKRHHKTRQIKNKLKLK